MHSGIKISIVIPVYNSGQALKKCIDTIADQPYEDYEVILVDDGSTDAVTLDLLSYGEQLYKRVRVFHKNNGGCIDARRYGVRQARGTYITFGDGDDFFADNYVDVVHKALEHPADLYVLNNYLNQRGSDVFYVEKKLPANGYIELDWLVEQLLSVKMNAVWDKIYKRELFGENVDIIPENIIYGEDIYLNNQYLPRVKAVYIQNSAIFYHYVDSNTSVCGRNASIKRLNDTTVVMKSIDALEGIKEASSKRKECFKDCIYGVLLRNIAGLKKQGVANSDICQNLPAEFMVGNIKLHHACSVKGLVYRGILKYRCFHLAEVLVHE